MRRRCFIICSYVATLLAVITSASAGAPAHAQPGTPPTPEEHPSPTSAAPPTDTITDKPRLVERTGDAFDRNDYPEAERLLRRLIKLDDDNFVPWYNLACAIAPQGEARLPEAQRALDGAIERGFSDLRQMTRDPYLRPLRDTARFKQIVAAWDSVLGARAEARIKAAREHFGPKYTYERDETLRLMYVSAFDAAAFARAKQDIGQCAGWWERHIVSTAPPSPPEGGPGPSDDGARRVAVPPAPPWVLVVLPETEQYAAWAVRHFGEAWQQIGGSYDDDEKSLWAMDLGPTLRHEFWHVLHWRDMRRRGQMHPPWIMEGLCSLVEDARAGGDGELIVLASWRTNIAKRLERGNRLMPLERLFSLDHERFVGNRPLAQYAQSRALFEYLADTGRLAAWYGAYVGGYAEDSTGKAALETVFAKPLKEIERDFKKWLRAREGVPDDLRHADAGLPFEVEQGEGDGLVVVQIDRPAGGRRSSRGNQSVGGLGAGDVRVRDIITEVGGIPVRDISELVRALEGRSAGEDIEVGYRRGNKRGTTTVSLGRAR
ncbi:MAG: PDZ domain-containing protein [Phycisphaerales bacterium]|nr:PDZ domain-containing protein [Phycisphaerales bacterium]